MQTNQILKKQLSISYAGNAQNYQNFRKMTGASKIIYPHDYHFYNDDIETRHSRNIKELSYIRTLLREGKIEPKQLPYNIHNTYYPSYVLHHHYQIFVPLLQKFRKQKQIEQMIIDSNKLNVIGAVFQAQIRLDFQQKNDLVTLSDMNQIKMNSQSYFYSPASSPYISLCAFKVKKNNQTKICIVQIRDKEGQWVKNINIRDLGTTISKDYLQIGYNFNNVKPLIILNCDNKQQKKLSELVLKNNLHQFYFSLRDIGKSLYVTIKYTAMRRQFKTVDNSKEQRKIISYQAVAGRIVDAYAIYLALSDLYSRLIEQERRFLALAKLIESSHHIILERMIILRQCCGGFGFMQVSGHPGCIERTAFRAGFKSEYELPLSPAFLQAVQYFTSTDQAEQIYCSKIVNNPPKYMDYFGVFVSICCRMRNRRTEMTHDQYNRQFLKQCAIQSMHGREQFSRQNNQNVHNQMLNYLVCDYVIQNVKFINWELIAVQRRDFFEKITAFKNERLNQIAQNLQNLGDTLELQFLRNTIIGRADSKDFYRQMIEVSKNNLRNSKQFVDYVKAPLVDFLIQNRSRL